MELNFSFYFLVFICLWECIWWLNLFLFLFYRKLWIKFYCGWVINKFNGYLTYICVLLGICYSILPKFCLFQFPVLADHQFSGYQLKKSLKNVDLVEQIKTIHDFRLNFLSWINHDLDWNLEHIMLYKDSPRRVIGTYNI